MTVAISFIPPIFEDEYDGLKMRTLVNELERLHAEIIRSFDIIDTTGNEINDLSVTVTWANVPNANITAGSVTQHVAAIDHNLLLNFLSAEHIDWALTGAEDIHADRFANSPAEVNDLTAAVTWANIPDANVPASAVTQHQAALTILESQITDGSLLAREGANANFAALTATTFGGILESNLTSSALNGQLITGAWDFTGTTDFWSATRIGNAGQTDYVTFSHDGVDFNSAATLTTDWNITGITRFKLNGVVTLQERAAAPGDEAAYGQYWVRNDVPNTPMFTRDDGTDVVLGLGTGASTAVFKHKTANQTYSNDTTLNADTDLTFSGLDANSFYAFWGFLDVQSVSAADIKFAFTYSDAPQDGNSAILLSSTGGAFIGDTSNSATATMSLFFSGSVADGNIQGFVRTNATIGGSITLNHAQITSNVGVTGLRAGSWMALQKLT